MLQRLLKWLVAAIIAHAMKTPYFHLPGYMERYWVVRPRWWTLGFSIRVHHILRSDTDRVLHDHPFPFATLIMRGGYWEERPVFDEVPAWAENIGEPVRTTWHGAGSILVRRAGDRHRLRLPRHSTAWTLFVMGPRMQWWGFYVPGRGKVHWKAYLSEEDATYQREQLLRHRGAETAFFE